MTVRIYDIPSQDHGGHVRFGLVHGDEVHPPLLHEEYIDLLGAAVDSLISYIRYEEPTTHYPNVMAPLYSIVRRSDGGHTMEWTRLAADGENVEVVRTFDLNLEAFARSIYHAMRPTVSWPQWDNNRLFSARSVDVLGALLGLSAPPPPKTYTLRAYQTTTFTPFQLRVNWDTFALTPHGERVIEDGAYQVNAHFVFDDDAKVFPATGIGLGHEDVVFILEQLWDYWTLAHILQLWASRAFSVDVSVREDAGQTDIVLRWSVPTDQVPPYATLEPPVIMAVRRDGDELLVSVGDAPDDWPSDDTGLQGLLHLADDELWDAQDAALFAELEAESEANVEATYRVPNVDMLAFTRQVIDAARTLLRLLDERGQMRGYARQITDMADELAHVADLVQANTPPGNA